MKTALIITIAALYLTSPLDKVYDHYCHYPFWIGAGYNLSNNRSQSELIVITVVRPVTLKRLAEFWLQSNDGADITEDGIVNFKDFALWALERR